MAEKQENVIQGTLNDMGKKIKMKRAIIKTLELEYQNACKKSESNKKELEDLASNIFTLEGQSSSSECRLEKYQMKETEWGKENQSLKQDVDDVKKSLIKARKLIHDDDVTFDKNVIKLVEKRHKERKLYDSRKSKDTLRKLELMDRAIVQEILDVENMLKEEKKKHPFEDLDADDFFFNSTYASASINQEINHLYKKKINSLKNLDDLMDKVKILEEEIRKLKNKL